MARIIAVAAWGELRKLQGLWRGVVATPRLLW